MEEIKIKEEAEGASEIKKEKIKTVEIIILGLAVGFVLTVSGFFIWNRNLKKGINGQKNQVEVQKENLQKNKSTGNRSGEEEKNEQPKDLGGIEVTEPTKNSLASNPLIVKGRARGNWFFEAEFPVKLMDGNGKTVTQSFATAEGEWMTEDFVSFTATIKFNAPQTDNGFVVLSKNNPSGMPENDYSVSIPIKFRSLND